MSILQTGSQAAATALKMLITENPGDFEWPGYVNACYQISERHTDPVEKALTLNMKRAHALGYLGNKAGGYGEAYSTDNPRVFTQQFVYALGEANSAWRAKRNPRLGVVLTSTGGIGTSGNENVLPFGPQIIVSSEMGSKQPA